MANYNTNRGRSSQGYGRHNAHRSLENRRADRGTNRPTVAERVCEECGSETNTWSKSYPDLCLYCAGVVARREREEEYFEVQEPAAPRGLLWAISIAARFEGDYIHGAIYTVEVNEQRAKAAGLAIAQRDYPPDEGYSDHNAAVRQVQPEHIEQVMR